MTPIDEALLEILERSRAAGFLGPGPVEPHVRHADGFAEAAEAFFGRPPASFADLGTGGGIPGLVLAARWPETAAVFVESGKRRSAWLGEAVEELGLSGRVMVLADRAEAVARDESRRERFELVTARSFAAPPITAEIAAGLVEVGGVLLVSEPPEPDSDRWPTAALEELGFGAAERIGLEQGHFVVVGKGKTVPARFPRTVGKPGKRPLW
jgi:16S rRNA (guanine527-N7)-methyltransferase